MDLFAGLVSIDNPSLHEAEMCARLKEELRALGAEPREDDTAAKIGGNAGNLYAYFEGEEGMEPLLLSAHMDSVEPACGKRAVFREDGTITSDGTTLLGADDKAGIAEIINALERLVKSGEKHGNIKICFTPDEEIGRGADNLSLGKLGADYGYTFDGGALGGIEYENFNAAGATVNFTGFSVHPGDAYGKMKNAALIAAEFTSLLPCDEVPEKTRGYEGFFHLTDMSGSIEHACLKYIIRDHDRAKFEEKKKVMENAVKTINEKYGEGTARAEIKDSYYNMREIIEKNPDVLERAREAMREEGVEPYSSPIRGGTDGARLSFMGLPCPNLCTGGHMYHSRHEYAVLEHMEKCADIALRLMTDTVKYKNGKN